MAVSGLVRQYNNADEALAAAEGMLRGIVDEFGSGWAASYARLGRNTKTGLCPLDTWAWGDWSVAPTFPSTAAGRPHRALGQAVIEFMYLSYEPEVGALLTVDLRMSSDGAFEWRSSSSEMSARFKFSPESASQELKLFPRDEQHVPEWMRELLGPDWRQLVAHG